jgi:2-dehydropantoate 2-reductase
MKMLIVGAGATGGFFGARLTQAGRDVSFLVRPKRAEQLRQSGLQVTSPHGDFSVDPRVLTQDQLTAEFDAILLTVKAYALDQALADIAPAVGPETLLLSTLNGMKHLDQMAMRFSNSNVLGCVCRIESTVDEDGRIVQFSKINDMTYGELDGPRSARIESLDAFMQGAQFEARISDDIRTNLWEKWTLLASLGVSNCLARGHIGEIVNAIGGIQLIERVLAEVVGTVRANGGGLSESYVQGVHKMLTNPLSKQTSSMYRDLQNGNAVEAEQIVGDLITRARRAEVPVPLLETAFTQLQAYQNRP